MPLGCVRRASPRVPTRIPASQPAPRVPAQPSRIKALLREIRRAGRSRQKTLRNKLRREHDFYISDFATDQQGFTASDVDDLVRRGVITLIDDLDRETTTNAGSARRSPPKDSVKASAPVASGVVDAVSATFDRGGLEAVGFVGWEMWVRLRATDLVDVPSTAAAYVVYRPSVTDPTFLEESPAGHFKGQDPTVAVEILRAKWVTSAHTLYIGKADVARRRLREFARFGAGKPVGHRGGRYIWQLADADDLLVAWRPIEGEGTARDYEKRLIVQFAELHDGRRPFANLTG